jgi:organic hydroperoxide reductase OsmC/OhrA
MALSSQVEDFCPVAKLIRGNVKIVSEGKLLYKLTA